MTIDFSIGWVCGIAMGYLLTLIARRVNDARKHRIGRVVLGKILDRDRTFTEARQIQPATVCAWCLKHMRGPVDATVIISHSICPDCAAKELAKLPNLSIKT